MEVGLLAGKTAAINEGRNHCKVFFGFLQSCSLQGNRSIMRERNDGKWVGFAAWVFTKPNLQPFKLLAVVRICIKPSGRSTCLLSGYQS